MENRKVKRLYLLVLYICLNPIGKGAAIKHCDFFMDKPVQVASGDGFSVQCLILTKHLINIDDTTILIKRHCSQLCPNGTLADSETLSNVKTPAERSEENFLVAVNVSQLKNAKLKKLNASSAVACLSYRSKVRGQIVSCDKNVQFAKVLCRCDAKVSCKLSTPCHYDRLNDRCKPPKYSTTMAEYYGCPKTTCTCYPCNNNQWSQWSSWSATCELANRFRSRPFDNSPNGTLCTAHNDNERCCVQKEYSTKKACQKRIVKREPPVKDTPEKTPPKNAPPKNAPPKNAPPEKAPPKNAPPEKTPPETGDKKETNVVKKEVENEKDEKGAAWLSIIYLLAGVGIAVFMIMLKRAGVIAKMMAKLKKKLKGSKKVKTSSTTDKNKSKISSVADSTLAGGRQYRT